MFFRKIHRSLTRPAFFTSTLLACALSAALPASSQAEPSGKPLKVPNLDFEDDLTGWKVAKSGAAMVAVSTAAGHEGKGVRVNDDNATLNARLSSEKAPATPGKTYEAHFQARNLEGPKGVGGFLVFYNNAGERLEPDHESGHHQDVPAAYKEWTPLKLNSKAPADAAFVGVEIRSNKKSIIKADFDDFQIFELP